MRTSSSLSRSGYAGSSRQASVASILCHNRSSRSHSRVPGLADQIRQILRAELDRRCRFSSSSGGSSDLPCSPQTDSIQSDDRHRRHVCARRSSNQPCRQHAHRFHSFLRSDCSCAHSRSPRHQARSQDRAVSHGLPLLEHARPFLHPSCTVSVAPAMPPGALQATSCSAPVLLFILPSLSSAVSPLRTAPRVLIPVSEAPPGLPSTQVIPTRVGSSSPQGEAGASSADVSPIAASEQLTALRVAPQGGLILLRPPWAHRRAA